jgi:hypothetical protein
MPGSWRDILDGATRYLATGWGLVRPRPDGQRPAGQSQQRRPAAHSYSPEEVRNLVERELAALSGTWNERDLAPDRPMDRRQAAANAKPVKQRPAADYARPAEFRRGPPPVPPAEVRQTAGRGLAAGNEEVPDTEYEAESFLCVSYHLLI